MQQHGNKPTYEKAKHGNKPKYEEVKSNQSWNSLFYFQIISTKIQNILWGMRTDGQHFCLFHSLILGVKLMLVYYRG